MRRYRQVLTVTLIVLSTLLGWSLTVRGTTDVGNGACIQGDGQVGAWNGSTADDEGCITIPEYADMFGPAALDSVVSAGPELEPDAPTVKEWFNLLFAGPR